MDSFESNTHSFIVKVWLEETVEEVGRATWRGHMTHVLSGKRYSIKRLGDISSIIAPYLEKMGVELRSSRRTRVWMKKWRR